MAALTLRAVGGSGFVTRERPSPNRLRSSRWRWQWWRLALFPSSVLRASGSCRPPHVACRLKQWRSAAGATPWAAEWVCSGWRMQGERIHSQLSLSLKANGISRRKLVTIWVSPKFWASLTKGWRWFQSQLQHSVNTTALHLIHPSSFVS